MHGWREDVADAARGESKPENLLYIMFAHTETSQTKGKEFLGRFCSARRGATPRRATPHATRSKTRSSSGASPTTAHSSHSRGSTAQRSSSRETTI
jgi:hypothetical protein